MAAGQELPIGFVAVRVEDAPEGGKRDVAYPFFFRNSMVGCS
jgi:hypothetical protein